MSFCSKCDTEATGRPTRAKDGVVRDMCSLSGDSHGTDEMRVSWNLPKVSVPSKCPALTHNSREKRETLMVVV